MAYPMGIDYGTTNSMTAILNNNNAVTLLGNNYADGFPSIAVFDPRTRELHFDGVSCANLANGFSDCVVHSAKTHLIDDRISLNYHYNGRPGHETFSAADITTGHLSALLKESRNLYRSYTQQDAPAEIVLTYPVSFSDIARRSLIAAAEKAELPGGGHPKVVGTLPEPCAAALPWLCQRGFFERTVIVFDCGGGTLDTSVVTLSRSAAGSINCDCLYSGGIMLGGDDFTTTLRDHVSAIFTANGLLHPAAYADELWQYCERAKKLLSKENQAEISMPTNQTPFSTEITRTAFEELCQPLVKKCIDLLDTTVSQAPSACSDILLVGGSCQLPALRDAICSRYGARYIINCYEPSRACAMGAAIYAASLSNTATDRHVSVPAVTQRTTHAYGVTYYATVEASEERDIQEGQLIMQQLISSQTELPADSGWQQFYTRNWFSPTVQTELYQYDDLGRRERIRHVTGTKLGKVRLSLGRLAKRGAPLEARIVISAMNLVQISLRDDKGHIRTISYQQDRA